MGRLLAPRAARLALVGVTAALTLVGCTIPEPDDSGDGNAGTGSAEPSTRTVTRTKPAPKLPPEPRPATTGECPYLPTPEVESANGQGVGQVRLSADEPHPACFFYRPDGEQQLSVHVYVGEPDVATGLVDRAAPVDTSNPTEQPSGWSGGYQSGDDGAVYAVSKKGTAVIVTTNQQQSVKARSVTIDVIDELAL